MRGVTCGLLTLMLVGCSTTSSLDLFKKSEEEVQSGYTYVPIDPFPVSQLATTGCPTKPAAAGQPAFYVDNPPFVPLLKALPDNAVRMLVETYDNNGNVTYGSSKITGKANFYRVTVDYINADTINVQIWVKRTLLRHDHKRETVPLNDRVDTSLYVPNSDLYEARKQNPYGSVPPDGQVINLPVYIGIGLRVTANVEDLGGTTNVSGIGIIGAEADLNHLRGSLIVQTLGINGKSVAAALPIQSELNRTTAQNAIVAVGSIKALLYSADAEVAPRVVGLYLPVNGGKNLVNAIISALATDGSSIQWYRSCEQQDKKPVDAAQMPGEHQAVPIKAPVPAKDPMPADAPIPVKAPGQ